MSDGTGTATYNYDQLSRMTSETRAFTLPEFNHSYTISYGYNLSGQLASIIDPSGAQVSYNYDASGRLSSMPASGYDGVTSFLSNPSYRATGAIKHATYGNGVQLNVTYNSRMQIGQYQVSSANFNVGATMSYYNDGRTNTAFDLSDARFDRKYEFDFSARLKEAYSGVEAHGAPPPPLNQANSPYRQSYTYDEWNNATSRTGRIWAVQTESDTASYGSDNKNGNWTYDAAGNATFTGYQDGWRTYDPAGRPVTFTSGQNWQVYPNWPSGHPDAPALETEDTFDGTGQVIKHVNHTRHDDSYADLSGNITYNMTDTTVFTYYLHSTVLGGKTIAELDQNGVKTKGYVYAGGARVATQTVNGGSNTVQLEATNPVTGAAITTDANGTYAARKEPDPLGRELATAPDPTIAVDPLASSKWNDPMPIEYSPQWTGEMERGMRDYLRDVAAATERYIYNANKREFLHALFDLVRTSNNKYYDKMQKILTENPNFVIELNGTMTAGQDAADAFTTALANLPGDPLGLGSPQSARRFAHAQGNTSQQPSPRGFPCPPTVNQIFAGGPAVTTVLDKTWEANRHQNPWTEQGGWIYMNKRGRLKAVAKDRAKQKEPGDRTVSINLSNPPSMRGWIVVGTFHTHDFDSDPSMPTGEQYSLPNDLWINEGQRVPGIILGGVLSGTMAFRGYGPNRGYWRSELPKRCR